MWWAMKSEYCITVGKEREPGWNETDQRTRKIGWWISEMQQGSKINLLGNKQNRSETKDKDKGLPLMFFAVLIFFN